MILVFSEKVSTTSQRITGASASLTSFFPSSLRHKLSANVKPLMTALASERLPHFFIVVKILGTIPLLTIKSRPFF